MFRSCVFVLLLSWTAATPTDDFGIVDQVEATPTLLTAEYWPSEEGENGPFGIRLVHKITDDAPIPGRLFEISSISADGDVSTLLRYEKDSASDTPHTLSILGDIVEYDEDEIQDPTSRNPLSADRESFALGRFATRPEFAALPLMSRILGQDYGLSSKAHPLAAPLHTLATHAAEVYNVDAGRNNSFWAKLVPCMEKVGLCVNPGKCPSQQCKNDCATRPLTPFECGNDCQGMCGPSCSCCWDWVCGDCCFHQGCMDRRQECEGPNPQAVFSCWTGRGTLWGRTEEPWMACGAAKQPSPTPTPATPTPAPTPPPTAGPPKCPPGSKLKKSGKSVKCVEDKKCKPGYRLFDGKCKPKDCPKGYVRDENGDCQAKPKPTPSCPEGTVLVGSKCTPTSTPAPTPTPTTPTNIMRVTPTPQTPTPTPTVSRSTPTPTQRPTPTATQPTPTPTQSTTPTPTQSTTPTPTQRPTPTATQPATPTPTQPATKPPTKPPTQPPTKPPTKPPTQPPPRCPPGFEYRDGECKPPPTPSPTPTQPSTPRSTPTPTSTPRSTPTPSSTPTPRSTPTPTSTPRSTPTPASTPKPTPSPTPTPTSKPTPPPACRPPLVRKNGLCVPCTPPTLFKSGKCVPCAPPTVYRNGKCVDEGCFPPFVYVNGRCTECPPPKKYMNGQCGDQLEFGCPPWAKKYGNQCIAEYNCWNKRYTAKPVSVACPSDLRGRRGLCALWKNKCLNFGCVPGFVPKGTTCVKCKAPLVYINGRCEPCKAPTIYQNGRCTECKKPQVYKNGECITPECPPPSKKLGDRCVLEVPCPKFRCYQQRRLVQGRYVYQPVCHPRYRYWSDKTSIAGRCVDFKCPKSVARKDRGCVYCGKCFVFQCLRGTDRDGIDCLRCTKKQGSKICDVKKHCEIRQQATIQGETSAISGVLRTGYTVLAKGPGWTVSSVQGNPVSVMRRSGSRGQYRSVTARSSWTNRVTLQIGSGPDKKELVVSEVTPGLGPVARFNTKTVKKNKAQGTTFLRVWKMGKGWEMGDTALGIRIVIKKGTVQGASSTLFSLLPKLTYYGGSAPNTACTSNNPNLRYRQMWMASAGGDTHMTTFDGCPLEQSYEGDFTLLKYSSHLHVQGRFVRFGKGTVMTGFALKMKGHTFVIQGKLRKLPELLHNGKPITKPYISKALTLKPLSSVELLVRVAGVLDIACKLHPRVGMITCAWKPPMRFKGKVKLTGLMGNFDGIPCNSGVNGRGQLKYRVPVKTSLFPDKTFRPNLGYRAPDKADWRGMGMAKKFSWAHRTCKKAGLHTQTRSFTNCMYDLWATNEGLFASDEKDGTRRAVQKFAKQK